MTIGALGQDPGAERRCSLRHRKECCVCARAKWVQEMEEVYFFRTPPGGCEDALVSEIGMGGAAVPVREDAVGFEHDSSVQEVSRRQLAQEMFSPERYHGRWSYSLPGHEALGGIPLAELRASAVPDPVTGRLWLLHRKVFPFLADGRTVDVAKKVPICKDCRVPLARLRPGLPKFALANDLWVGRLPDALAELSEGAKLLLPLARALIKRYNCKTEGSKWRH